MDTLPHHVPQRQCTKCRHWLPSHAFSPSYTPRKQSWCKNCINAHKRATRTPLSMRDEKLRRKYGITIKQYDRMLQSQSGVCAVCKAPETRREGRSKRGGICHLAVDHDHKTGRPRALLCHACNVSLGQLHEDPQRIKALLSYAEWCQTLEEPIKIIQLRLVD
jgi:hypothetical protein